MTALVVYESMFGNTKRIAEAIARGLGATVPTKTVEVGDAPEEITADIDLLVVGGPTHAHGMSTSTTRANAGVRSATLVSQRIGIREWLDRARPAVFDIHAAAFDTRINALPLLTGSAAKGYAKGLKSAGFRVDEPIRSFLVGARVAAGEDALLAGQLDAARQWGERLARTVRPVVR